MIIQEHFDVNGHDFIRTYSNTGHYVVRNGINYSEACDPAEFERIYTEGEPIAEDDLIVQTNEIINILLGNY